MLALFFPQYFTGVTEIVPKFWAKKVFICSIKIQDMDLERAREIALQPLIAFANESSLKMVSLKIMVPEDTSILTKMESQTFLLEYSETLFLLHVNEWKRIISPTRIFLVVLVPWIFMIFIYISHNSWKCHEVLMYLWHRHTHTKMHTQIRANRHTHKRSNAHVRT